MKQQVLIVALTVAIGALIFLQVRSCRREPVHSREAQLQAGMMQRLSDSIRHLQALEDSLVIRKKDRAIDSLIPLANLAKKALNDKGKQIAGTIAVGDKARADHDTAAIVSNCDSLRDQVVTAGRLLGGYEYLNDSVITLLQEQRHIQDSLEVIHRREKELLLTALDSSDSRIQQLDSENGRLRKQANKRWSAGPGGGAFLLGGQPKGSVGITVHYNLFKF